MASIRKTKTASGAVAVQVVRYHNRQVVVLKHIGSGHTTEEIAALVESARVVQERITGQPSLFAKQAQRTLPLAKLRYVGVTHRFARDALWQIAQRCGFNP